MEIHCASGHTAVVLSWIRRRCTAAMVFPQEQLKRQRERGRRRASEYRPSRSKCGHTATGIGKELLSRDIRAQEFPISATERRCRLTAPDIFDHLVKSGLREYRQA
jgi:hypothetical protein